MKSRTVNNYRIAKWAFFGCAIAFYFLPFVITTACLIPATKQENGLSWAIGLAIVVLHAIPLVFGLFKSVLAHYPMVMGLTFSVAFLALYGFFTSEVFKTNVSTFCWIEFAFCLGCFLSIVFWYLYRKNARRLEMAKANKEMGLI